MIQNARETAEAAWDEHETDMKIIALSVMCPAVLIWGQIQTLGELWNLFMFLGSFTIASGMMGLIAIIQADEESFSVLEYIVWASAWTCFMVAFL